LSELHSDEVQQLEHSLRSEAESNLSQLRASLEREREEREEEQARMHKMEIEVERREKEERVRERRWCNMSAKLQCYAVAAIPVPLICMPMYWAIYNSCSWM